MSAPFSDQEGLRSFLKLYEHPVNTSAYDRCLEGFPGVFSAAVLDHTLNPRNTGPLEGANRFGQAGDPGGGPYALLWFVVDGQTILRGSYETYGCPAAVACASFAAEFLKGKSIDQALAMDSRDIALLLGGLPEGKGHCPALVVDAIRIAFSEGLK